ncbi:MAG: hypothetical protein LC739_04945 [Actinobacteria bacterium]|nr:hypothetical protein [Actinomycetota bacterium]
MFVYGNQKSGTSAIAGLLGAYANLSVTIDLPREIREQLIPDIFTGRGRLETLLRHNRAGFGSHIVKHPNLALLHSHLVARFPAARHVFVVRRPPQNIRSILDRLGLAGDLVAVSPDDWERMPRPWQSILQGQPVPPERLDGLDYVEILAERWNLFTDCYLEDREQITLVRYEDFVADKSAVIGRLAAAVGLAPRADISELLAHQYQPAGVNRDRSPESFFGSARLERIEAICGPRMRVLGY